jgi:hypothetical protein
MSMGERISRVVESGSALVDAFARLNIARLQSAVISAGAWAAAGLLAFVACGVLLAAAAVALAASLGTPAALAIIGGGLLLLAGLLGLSAMGIAKARESKVEEQLEQRARAAQKEFAAAFDVSDAKPGPAGPGFLEGLLKSRSPLDAAVRALRSCPPATIGAAAVGVAALMGPFRALRIIARAAAAIAAIRAISESLRDLVQKPEAGMNSRQGHQPERAPTEGVSHDGPAHAGAGSRF